jgi:hypothetical protein
MQDRWTAGRQPINGAGNIYANLIDAFAAATPAVSEASLETAREVARLLARSIVCADRVIDGDVSRTDQVENVLAAQICQLEAVRLLQVLVAPAHRLWAEIAHRLREFAEACAAEANARTHRALPIADVERIALGKNALARITGPLTCAIAGDEQLAAVFDRAISDLIITVQALDDAMDWRSDLAAQRISLITARVWSRYEATAPAEEVTAYVHRHAIREVLQQGESALASATGIPELRASPIWLTLTARIADGYRKIFEVLPRG